MNLFKAIDKLKTDLANEELVNAIYECIEDRQDFLEEREPESEGETHDLWEEKCDEWGCIVDYAQDLVGVVEDYKNEIETYDSEDEDEAPDPDIVLDALEILKDSLQNFQSIYGGISRLQVEM